MNNDLWALTSYFNPLRYRTRRENFELFAQHMADAGVRLVVAEMAVEDSSFELPPSEFGIQLNGGASVWQKERLLNVALAALPPECQKVAWLDCDLIFDNPEWARQTAEALDRHAVVQPFDTAIWLPRGGTRVPPDVAPPAGSKVMRSFAAVFADDCHMAQNGLYVDHGHTGFAWAARRDVLETVGLYDACLTGSGDHLMAHVFAGADCTRCTSSMIHPDSQYFRHFTQWAVEMNKVCKGRLGYVPGRVFHLWHGNPADRGYAELNSTFKEFDFDPGRDIQQGAVGLWEWADASPELRAWSAALFAGRKEDG